MIRHYRFTPLLAAMVLFAADEGGSGGGRKPKPATDPAPTPNKPEGATEQAPENKSAVADAGKPQSTAGVTGGGEPATAAVAPPTQDDQAEAAQRQAQAALAARDADQGPSPDPAIEDRLTASSFIADKSGRTTPDATERRADWAQFEARNDRPVNTQVGGFPDAIANPPSDIVKALGDTQGVTREGQAVVFRRPYGSEPRNYDVERGEPIPAAAPEELQGVHGLDQYADVDGGTSAAMRRDTRAGSVGITGPTRVRTG